MVTVDETSGKVKQTDKEVEEIKMANRYEIAFCTHSDDWQLEKPAGADAAANRHRHREIADAARTSANAEVADNLQYSLGHIDPTAEQWDATPDAPEPTNEELLQ
jgi:hypothetical protein